MIKRATYLYSIFFILLFLANGRLSLKAQDPCFISINAELPVCPGNAYILSVPFHENCIYTWKANNSTIDDQDTTVVAIIDEETTFTVTVTDTLTSEECMSDLVVTTYPPIVVTFEQLQLTCTNTFSDNPDDENKTKTAIMKATAGDEFEPGEYQYLWDVSPLQIDPQDSSIAFGLKAHLKYFIDIKDKFGCIKRDTAVTKAFDNPVIKMYTDPDKVAYIQNPHVTFSFENLSSDSIPVTNHVWNFGDCECFDLIKPECCSDITTTQDMPVHTYLEVGEYNPYIQVFNQYGCDTIYFDTLEIKPVKLKVPNIFTPNGDGVNDEFIITEAPPEEDGEDGKSSLADDTEPVNPINTYYERSELVIFNRQGRIVYRSNDYQNDWDGSDLPDAVYFYILKCFGTKSDDVYKGSVTIYGSGR